MTRIARLLPIVLIALAACTTVSPEAKVRAKLIEAGVKPPVASCMAERLVDRLSLAQLKRLQSLSGLARKDVNAMSIDEIAHRLRGLDDPEITAVVLKTGLGCSIGF
ncbi:hypothetical protein [Sphingomonas montanisoli]|uniref:Lipoprotein n=1 Tax=Sphingomonas montanisoli TaxID=2606412 RepID=A0A5D9C6D9_9SPHN|nr:hypothetical protein [Sphingomonas montanisoli]TZG27249.1 hypothetical protein FYJ91_06395 [Sphingomonas montanisoli]